VIQTASLLNETNIQTFIIPGISALAALVSVIAVIVNTWLARRREEHRENADLSFLGPELHRFTVGGTVEVKLSLANPSSSICAVTDIFVEIATPSRQRVDFWMIDWVSINPSASSQRGYTRDVAKKVPFPVFPLGITRVNCVIDSDKLNELDPSVERQGTLCVVYKMGQYREKKLRSEFSLGRISALKKA